LYVGGNRKEHSTQTGVYSSKMDAKKSRREDMFVMFMLEAFQTGFWLKQSAPGSL